MAGFLCPHCRTTFTRQTAGQTPVHGLAEPPFLIWQTCPACEGLLVWLADGWSPGGEGYQPDPSTERLIYPTKTSPRPPAPQEVPSELAQDYTEACLVLAESPKEAAALARRCLQRLIREHLGIKKRDLDKEIDAVVAEGKLPSAVLTSLDAIRQVGNFAAHPVKSESSGEIVDVEPGEAEWTLDVLEGLFDVLFVVPAQLMAKQAALDAKLSAAGKPPLKQPSP